MSERDRIIVEYLKTRAGKARLARAIFPEGIRGRVDDLIELSRSRNSQDNREGG